MRRLTLGLVLLSSAALALQAPSRPDALREWEAYLPEENTDPDSTDYASSRVCKSCHPAEYDSWYGSYHRTMTQWAGPESIVPAWEGVDFGYEGRSYRLFRRDDEFFVDMPKHGTTGARQEDRLELPVVMTTGSHQMQYYWLPAPWARLRADGPIAGEREFERFCSGCHGDDGEGGSIEGESLAPIDPNVLWNDVPQHESLGALEELDGAARREIERFLERIQFPGRVVQFPFVYVISEERWLHDSYTFLQPEETFTSVEPYGKNWNGNCDDCHTTAPEYRWDRDERLGQTSVAELGIACEACHGAGRAHVERHRNPVLRYRAHLGGAAPDDIVNPAKLDATASASVCAQCHAELVPSDNEDRFQPGDVIDRYAHVLELSDPPRPAWLEHALADEPDLLGNVFWPDGTIRVAGRDYNGLAKSACFLEGELSCVTCHTMHGSEPNDQLRAEARGDGACLSCHTELRDDVEAHTHHRATSEASRCYSCHMPHTTWGLLGSIRAHRIDSPSVATTIETGRPNACNLCHLDSTLEDMATSLSVWYSQPTVVVPERRSGVAASIDWAMSGDAVQRATAAWHMGYGPAKNASGDDWQPAYLVELLDDPYPAVRFRAFASLSGYPGFEDLRYDVQWPSYLRKRTVAEARQRVRLRGKSERPALLIRHGKVVQEELLALKALRDDTPVRVAE